MTQHYIGSKQIVAWPADKTCGDCVHIRRCKLIFGHVETDRYCDWSPSRFRAATEPAALAAKEGR